MKKILFVLTLIVATTFTAKAQFTDFGFRVGTGLAYHADDMATNSPILAANVGGFVNFGFTGSQSLLAEVFSLQSGINIIRRGSHYEEVLQDILSVRQGTYSSWAVQVPILASFRYELPVREPGHIGLLTIGPAVSYGLYGTKNEIIFTHGYPQSDWNHKISNEDVFKTLNKLDVSFLLGVGYETEDLQIILQLDYGMTSVADFDDALRNDNEYNPSSSNSVVKVPQGNNCALLLTVGYKFPIR